jgi:hypothetical protein
MTRKPFYAFLIVTLTGILSSFNASAQQVRVVPPNDSFATPTAITIGKSYAVADIGAATNQTGEPNATCNGNAPIVNSVWFTFTVPAFSFVSLSTFGSVLATDLNETNDTILAVYTPSGPGTFTESACNDDANGINSAQLVFAALGGVTYYVAAGTFDNYDFLPSSTLKHNTRMLSTSIPPVNPSFETPIGGPGWAVKNGDDDTRVCSDPIYPGLGSPCAFRFIGAPDRTTKLVQTMPFPSAFLPRKNGHLIAIFYVRIMDTGIIDNSKAKITVRYTDGTRPTVRTVNLTGLASTGDYLFHRVFIGLKSGKVASVKFEFKFGAEDGVLMVDEVLLYYSADPATRGAGLLPVPPSPAAK